MSDPVTEAVLKIYDHLTDTLTLIRTRVLFERGDPLVLLPRQPSQRVECLGLRDFVHGLNDRHTSLDLKLRADGSLLSRCAKCKGLGWLDGRKGPACATAPVAEVPRG